MLPCGRAQPITRNLEQLVNSAIMDFAQARHFLVFYALKVILVCVTVGLSLPSCFSQERCGLAKDFVVQALEQIKTGTTHETEDGLQLLKHANQQCAGLGDAWYYRSIFERKLGQVQKSDYSLGKAKLFGSEAMDEGLDPFALATGAVAAASGPVADKWGLVVGISKFHDPHVPRLNYASKDARDFASALTDADIGRFPLEHVHVVTDAEATTPKIKMELNWLARNAKPDDLVVVFLASHGSPRSRDIAGLNYIITSDTEVGDPEKDPDSLFATALPMVDLSDIVRSRIRARRTAIFLDTCHSGGAVGASGGGNDFGDASASPDALERIRQGVGRVIITSSTEKERSWESAKLHNGYFTYYLVEALKQANGLNPLDRIFESVRNNVSQKVVAEVRATQTPMVSRSARGAEEIVIGAPTHATGKPAAK